MKIPKTIRSLLLVLCLLISLHVPERAMAKGLNIVTDIAPVQALLTDITQGVSTPMQLVRPNISAHDFALKPSDIRAVQSADIIFWIGPIAVPGLAKILEDPQFRVKSVRLNGINGTLHLPQRHSGVFFPASATKTQATDPHTWLSPTNASLWVERIVAELAKRDPENGASYRQNGRALVADIARVTDQIDTQLAELREIRFVQYHDAFQYFENHFGLNALGFATVGGEESASLGAISDLRDVLGNHPHSCVFVISDAAKGRARPLLEDTEARLAVIDPTGGSLDGPPLGYTDLLQAIADGFLRCFASQE